MFRIVSTATLHNLRQTAERAEQERQEHAERAEQARQEAEAARRAAADTNAQAHKEAAVVANRFAELKRAAEDPDSGSEFQGRLALALLREQIEQLKADSDNELAESSEVKLLDMLFNEHAPDTQDADDAPAQDSEAWRDRRNMHGHPVGTDDLISQLVELDIDPGYITATPGGVSVDCPPWRPVTEPLLEAIRRIPGVRTVTPTPSGGSPTLYYQVTVRTK